MNPVSVKTLREHLVCITFRTAFFHVFLTDTYVTFTDHDNLGSILALLYVLVAYRNVSGLGQCIKLYISVKMFCEPIALDQPTYY
jgi:hypothetical protein